MPPDLQASSARDISAPVASDASEPQLWTRPTWMSPRTFAVIWLLLIAYGTLMPFDVAPHVFHDGFWSHLGRLEWVSLSSLAGRSSFGAVEWASDMALNVLLYAAFGGLLRLGLSRQRAITAVAIITAAGFTASYAMESLQDLMISRMGAWNDVASNTAGALIGALIAVPGRRLAEWLLFAGYRRVAGPLHAGIELLRRLRNQRVLIGGAIAVNAATLSMLTLFLIPPVLGKPRPGVNWAPFYDHFQRSYDVAAAHLFWSVAAYGIVGALLSIQFLRRGERRGLIIAGAAAAGLALAVETVRATFGDGRMDITMPVLATMTLGILVTASYLSVRAVRRACRRREVTPVANDRRRRPHDYRFAIHDEPLK